MNTSSFILELKERVISQNYKMQALIVSYKKNALSNSYTMGSRDISE